MIRSHHGATRGGTVVVGRNCTHLFIEKRANLPQVGIVLCLTRLGADGRGHKKSSLRPLYAVGQELVAPQEGVEPPAKGLGNLCSIL
jgi:hypothetical protein